MTGDRVESADAVSRKYCKVCLEASFRLRTHADYAEVLRHYLREHPDDNNLQNVLQGSKMETPCDTCGQTFVSGVRVAHGKVWASSSCPECVEEKPLRGVYDSETSASAVITQEVDSCPA